MQHQYRPMTNLPKYISKQCWMSYGDFSNLKGKIIVFDFASTEKTLVSEKKKQTGTPM